MYSRLAVAAVIGCVSANAIRSTPINMGMYNSAEFAQTGSFSFETAEVEAPKKPKCVLKVHSIVPNLDLPKVHSIDQMPSFLKNRLARRHEAEGEEVPDYLQEEESNVAVEAAEPSVQAPVVVTTPVVTPVFSAEEVPEVVTNNPILFQQAIKKPEANDWIDPWAPKKPAAPKAEPVVKPAESKTQEDTEAPKDVIVEEEPIVITDGAWDNLTDDQTGS